MVYIEVNGLRLDQRVLLAIGEAVLAYSTIFLLFLIVNCPCLRLKDSRFRWLRLWRIHTSLYAVLALVSEILWVQVSLGSNTHSKAVGCPWTQGRLAAWAGVQLGCLVCLMSTLTYCQRRATASMVNGTVAMHAMANMNFAMLIMYQDGACVFSLFPILTGLFGMINICCCIPWASGAWTTEIVGDWHPRVIPATYNNMGPGSKSGDNKNNNNNSKDSYSNTMFVPEKFQGAPSPLAPFISTTMTTTSTENQGFDNETGSTGDIDRDQETDREEQQDEEEGDTFHDIDLERNSQDSEQTSSRQIIEDRLRKRQQLLESKQLTWVGFLFARWNKKKNRGKQKSSRRCKDENDVMDRWSASNKTDTEVILAMFNNESDSSSSSSSDTSANSSSLTTTTDDDSDDGEIRPVVEEEEEEEVSLKRSLSSTSKHTGLPEKRRGGHKKHKKAPRGHRRRRHRHNNNNNNNRNEHRSPIMTELTGTSKPSWCLNNLPCSTGTKSKRDKGSTASGGIELVLLEPSLNGGGLVDMEEHNDQ